MNRSIILIFVIGYTEDNSNSNNSHNSKNVPIYDYYPVDIPMYLDIELEISGQDPCYMYVLHEI